MPASKAQQKAVTKYMKENYDEIKVRMNKGQKDTIKAHASSHGESINGFIGRAILETMERDGTDGPQEAAGIPTGHRAVSLPPDTHKTAQEAAQATGEALPAFITRAVSETAERDRLSKNS